MSFVTRKARVTFVFVERNFNLVKRYWGWEIVWLVYYIVNALAITFIGKASAAITRQVRQVQKFVLQLRQMHDTTVLLTSHDMDEADRLCDRVAILDEGKIVALDTPPGLKAMVERTIAHEPTMEDAFMALTGKRLVDGEADVEEEPAFGHVL